MSNANDQKRCALREPFLQCQEKKKKKNGSTEENKDVITCKNIRWIAKNNELKNYSGYPIIFLYIVHILRNQKPHRLRSSVIFGMKNIRKTSLDHLYNEK